MTPEQFGKDLCFLYDKNPCLDKAYFKTLLTIFIEIYGKYSPPYEPYLEACITGIRNFGRTLPPTESIFRSNQSTPQAEAALRALADPLRKLKWPLTFKDTHVFEIDPPSVHDYTHRSDYSRALREHEKLEEQFYARMTQWDWALFATPLAPYSAKLTFPTPIPLPEKKRFLGTWVCAVSGKGKTNLLRNMVWDDMLHGHSVIILDSKGELLDTFRRMDGDNVVLLDPTEHLALNPLQIGKGIKTRELMEYLFGTLGETGELTGLQQALFRNVLTLCDEIPHATVHTLKDILMNGYERYLPYVSQLRDDRREFFEKQFNANQYRETKNQILWRLENLLSNDFMYKMLSAPETKINLEHLIDDWNLILIDNSKDRIGESGAEFFGRLVLALFLNVAYRRSGREGFKRPCFLYIDECQNVISRDKKIETLNDEARSQNMGVVLSHQRMNQMEVSVLDSVMNCGIKILNVDQDTHNLATRLNVEKPQLTLPVGNFLLAVQDSPPVAVQAPLFDLSLLPRLSPEGYEKRRIAWRERFGAKPVVMPAMPTLMPPMPTTKKDWG